MLTGHHRKHVVTISIFLAVTVSHIACGAGSWSDTLWSIPTSLSIVTEGNADLDEYKALLEQWNRIATETINGKVYAWHPITVHMLAVPAVAVCRLWMSPSEIIDSRIIIGRISASVIIALATVFIYMTANVTLNEIPSIIIAFIFAYCTSAWSTASRALWQHGPSMLMIAMGLFLLVKSKDRQQLIPLVGLTMGLAYIFRPSNCVSVIVISAYVLLCHRKQFPFFILWGLAVAVPFVLFSTWMYGTTLPPYYSTARILYAQDFGTALLGHLVSPSRGLFIFSPILLFSVYGMALKLKNKQMESLDYALALIIIAHWTTISLPPQWWGGYSYGPRFFSDVIPYFVYFLIPVFGQVSQRVIKRRYALITLLTASIAVSFLIHYHGSTDNRTNEWNYLPVSVDKHPERLWQWNDPQFLRGWIRWI